MNVRIRGNDEILGTRAPLGFTFYQFCPTGCKCIKCDPPKDYCEYGKHRVNQSAYPIWEAESGNSFFPWHWDTMKICNTCYLQHRNP